jgi:hypothetical protein
MLLLCALRAYNYAKTSRQHRGGWQEKGWKRNDDNIIIKSEKKMEISFFSGRK